MNRRVALVLGITILAVVATTLWVPLRAESYVWNADVPEDRARYMNRPNMSRLVGSEPTDVWPVARWGWVWSCVPETDMEVGYLFNSPFLTGRPERFERVSWSLVFAVQGLVVLVGGGLLTWVVRRERRRRAMA